MACDPYVKALATEGLRYRLAPASLSPGEAHDLLASASGLLLCGGLDVDPRSYGQERRARCGEIDAQRDRRERALIEAALASDVPILAICRGIQMLNVALGGTLYQDISTECPGSLGHRYVEGTCKAAAVHDVAVGPHTALADALGTTQAAVNSRHHQAVHDVACDLVVVARASDGVVEGAEMPGRTFVMGVQWHPEDMVAKQAHAARLFAAFARAASPRGRS